MSATPQSMLCDRCHAMASLQYKADQPLRFLTVEVFRALRFSELASVLDEGLEQGFAMMSAWRREDVLTKGEIPNAKSTRGPLR